MLKEFETIGFYLSDHPLNQYKDIFDEYNITKYSELITNQNQSESMVASTILKVQEKKTLNGTSYAIIKFSDLSGVFELFVFSEVFESNREILIEGNSVMITLVKNYNDENKVQKEQLKSQNDIINELYNRILALEKKISE